MMHAQKLFKSRAWYLLVPDFLREIMTEGYGVLDALISNENHAVAAITSDGKTIIAYLPSNRQVWVDLSKISGIQATCWWYNPTDGSTKRIGTYPTSGIRSFSPPSMNDWILVIDDSSMNFPAPGTGNYTQRLK